LKSSAERETICGGDSSESYTATRTSGGCPASSGVSLAFDVRRRKKSCMGFSPVCAARVLARAERPSCPPGVGRRVFSPVADVPADGHRCGKMIIRKLRISWRRSGGGGRAGAHRYGDHLGWARLSTGVEKIVDNLENLLQPSGTFLPWRVLPPRSGSSLSRRSDEILITGMVVTRLSTGVQWRGVGSGPSLGGWVKRDGGAP